MDLLKAYATRFNNYCLNNLPCDRSHLGNIYNAVNYSMSIGGKRIRPALVYACAESFGISLSKVDNIALAIECMHTYSLIHDDLPCMDDDDLRRSNPSCHIKFDEATAVLAGDALNTFAFYLLSSEPVNLAKQIEMLSLSAGISGMIAGQDMDLYAENNAIDIVQLKNLHKQKTAKLIQSSLVMPYLCQEEYDDEIRKILLDLGDLLGIYYQIQDDILDVTKTSKQLGKPSQSDLNNNKSTYVSLLGLDGSKKELEIYSEKILAKLNQLFDKDSQIHKIFNYIMQRNS